MAIENEPITSDYLNFDRQKNISAHEILAKSSIISVNRVILLRYENWMSTIDFDDYLILFHLDLNAALFLRSILFLTPFATS